MAQFARPIGDLDNTGVWTTAPLWSDIDEGGAGDGTVILSDSSATASETFTVDGATVTDPSVSTGHILRGHWAKNATGGANFVFHLQLRQGYSSEAAQGTLIATLVSPAISGTTLQTDTYTLSAGEADSITDYSDLQLRCWSQKSGGGAGRQVKIDFVELETPDVSADRRARVSWAEVELPTAPRRGQVSWAELEAPSGPRRAEVSWAELETPDAARRVEVSWTEMETGNAPRRAEVSWAELEIPPLPSRRGQVSWAEMEVGNAPRRAEVSWAELETPPANRRAEMSWAELETPAGPRRVEISFTEFEVPTVVTGGDGMPPFVVLTLEQLRRKKQRDVRRQEA